MWFKQLDQFEGIATPDKVHKTLIYGGDENQKRSKYEVISWKNIDEIPALV